MKCSAEFSSCRKYRYRLSRIWNHDVSPLVWVMFNPSTADQNTDDPTIRRCIGFSMNAGYGGIEVYNIFSYRDTFPKNLIFLSRKKDPFDIVGPKNDDYLKTIAEQREVVVAWGRIPISFGNGMEKRDFFVLRIFENRKLLCLGVNSDGTPKHPLYVSYARKFEEYDGAKWAENLVKKGMRNGHVRCKSGEGSGKQDPVSGFVSEQPK